ncbi:MAG TPA: CDP-glycerol glycerophosphotransferase family protein [Mycobacteriales bacterium]|jgi:CDP-glycerol glycerophosphotransferase (TagB/SpsB family)/glycosyltransferase involved in cell wall biosynthesis|nr:CDP-glycerol glycerophosphotransferase family protein [Mycobacteriales bacterium]
MSVVVAMFNIARYLPEFLDSVDAQRLDGAPIEFVFVDDGSPDESASLVRAWIERTPLKASLVSQANTGLAGARNRGLAEVSGTWVTFPDPDDRLDLGYFEAIQQFLRSEPATETQLVAANLLRLDDETGRVSNTHPLRFKFARGQRVIELDRQPRYIHLQAASAFYRRAVIERSSLRFDPRVRPNFEDAHFTARYLASVNAPVLAVIPESRYLYRDRADGSSLVQSSWTKAAKYTDLLEYGLLGLLTEIQTQRGAIPRWAQLLVIYELAFFFRNDGRPNSPTGGISEPVSERFHELLRRIMTLIDTEVIEDFTLAPMSTEARAALLIGAKGVEPSPPTVHIDAFDVTRQLVRVWYYYACERPSEAFRVAGLAVSPEHEKVRAVRFLGQTMLYQRIAWLPAAGTLAVELDGKRAPLALGRPTRPRYRAAPRAVQRSLGQEPALRVRVRRRRGRRQLRRQLLDAALRRYARSTLATRRYRDAWLLIDRDDQAQDNAERLYQHLKEHEPAVNAWFVLSKRSSDWDRLRRAGFRLIDHRSRRHTIALLNCRHLISSQVDHYVVSPLSAARFGRPRWKFTFLQHGVTKDDLSVWINPKPIELMISASPDEHASFVGDGTPYVHTTREVAMTGFPRHDRLLEIAGRTPADGRRLILVAPTWRRDLLQDRVATSNLRDGLANFWQSEYALAWRSFLESESLHAAVARHGWEVEFVPHPNMQHYLDTSPLPESITSHRFRDVDIQALLARAGILVTDYSSMAFEAAYLERPVVYFQFDQAAFFDGNHAYRRGEWDYETSGFGPVTRTVEAATEAVEELLARDGRAEPKYADRMAAALPLRDGKCCARTVEAIRALEAPQP